MIAATALCLLVLSPQSQGLHVPPIEPKPGAAAPAQRPLTEIERFRRDLTELNSSPPKVEAKLVEMGQSYPAIETLIVTVARTARAREMGELTVAARRFGTGERGARIADELLFQLLARPLGEATRATVETMAHLKGAGTRDDEAARRALQECIRGRIAGVRRHATDVLVTMVGPDDLHFAMQLSSEQNLDLQLRGVDLLAAIRDERARRRLVELLSKDPALAAAACEALVALRADAVPHLRQLCAEPPIDRGFAYAAFALAQIEDATGTPLLTAALAAPLATRLRDPELLTRSLAAIPLADLAHRGELRGGADGAAEVPADAAIVDALLQVVEPKDFVPNLDLLRRPAETRLLRFTGRVLAADALPWRLWWEGQRADFVGLRARLQIDETTAPFAVVTLRHDRQVLRLVAEGLADVPPLPDAQEVLVTGAQMQALAKALDDGGFGDLDAMRPPDGLPVVRSLQIQMRGSRAQVGMAATAHLQFDALVQLVQAAFDAELWQLYRHPADEPDRAAFWRAERRWLQANPDPVDRGRRFARRALRSWSVVSRSLQVRALERLFADPARGQLLAEEDGARILQIVRAAAQLGELELRLLELACTVPGDAIWRECVDAAAQSGADARAAVRGLFALLGPERVLAALHDERAVVRRAAIDEVAAVRDARAAARLVELLADADASVRLAATHAVGQMQIAGAARPLIAAIAATDTDPQVRRESLRALGRIGGEQAFGVLERALAAPAKEDKEAALRGLGELRDPRAAHLLAELAVIGAGKDLGTLARHYLQRQGGILAVPALRLQLRSVQEPATRTQLVLLLGRYQDPETVPDLLDLLRQQDVAIEAAALLAGTTGLDVLAMDDRIGEMEQWWRKNKAAPQWQWLLDALRLASVPTTLRAEHFAEASGLVSVPELARLLVEAKEPRLSVLASALLRRVTSEDYGAVDDRTPVDVREGIAARYRVLYESARAAAGR
jgi:HEAT repeat protein